MAQFRPFTQPRKVKQARRQQREKAQAQSAPMSMQKLTSGAWKRAQEVKRLRLPSGS
jgi:hypothetical protein